LLQLNNMAKHQMMGDLLTREIHSPSDLKRRSHSSDGLEIREESFATSFQDAIPLFEQHCVAIGEPPDEWTRNNIGLIEQMDKSGVLQILTARANGKMFGYLLTTLGIGIDSDSGKSASHTLFFASKEWPGAGLRLQRAALGLLKAKGYSEVIMRSGIGLGARVETIYKRLGAELDGKLYRIRLES
jgi:hypothetical protein